MLHRRYGLSEVGDKYVRIVGSRGVLRCDVFLVRRPVYSANHCYGALNKGGTSASHISRY